jgi:malonyl-CoA O-methyltransferase
MSKHKIEFSKYALSYEKYNTIQIQVVDKLIKNIDFKPKKILDLGCGSGQVYNSIDWDLDRFIAIDFSKEMCNLHKKKDYIKVICDDFDNIELYKKLEKENFDLILSSSALQWSKKLDYIANFLKNYRFSLSLFTSNTFKTIQNITNLDSPILSKNEIIDIFKDIDNIKIERVEYRLHFENRRDIFKYIKNSGVSGGVAKLSYKETKNLIDSYPKDYLEFEVLFIKNF